HGVGQDRRTHGEIKLRVGRRGTAVSTFSRIITSRPAEPDYFARSCRGRNIAALTLETCTAVKPRTRITTGERTARAALQGSSPMDSGGAWGPCSPYPGMGAELLADWAHVFCGLIPETGIGWSRTPAGRHPGSWRVILRQSRCRGPRPSPSPTA